MLGTSFSRSTPQPARRYRTQAVTRLRPNGRLKTAKFNGVDSEAWLTNTIARIVNNPARHVAELPHWNYRPA